MVIHLCIQIIPFFANVNLKKRILSLDIAAKMKEVIRSAFYIYRRKR